MSCSKQDTHASQFQLKKNVIGVYNTSLQYTIKFKVRKWQQERKRKYVFKIGNADK
jgi:hypothetical protein